MDGNAKASSAANKLLSSSSTHSGPYRLMMACTDPVSNPPTTTAAPFVSKAKNGRGSSSFNDCFAHERRSEEHTSELQSLRHLVCRLVLEKKNNILPRRSDLHRR